MQICSSLDRMKVEFALLSTDKSHSFLSDFVAQVWSKPAVFLIATTPWWGCARHLYVGVCLHTHTQPRVCGWSWAKLTTHAKLIRRYCITSPDNVLLCLLVFQAWNKPSNQRRKQLSPGLNGMGCLLFTCLLGSMTIFI